MLYHTVNQYTSDLIHSHALMVLQLISVTTTTAAAATMYEEIIPSKQRIDNGNDCTVLRTRA